MQITAKLVNDLRARTNVGMMECKKALVACDGDIEAAIEHLRKVGIMKAEEKQGRAAKQGLIFGKTEGNAAVLIELLCETDFVAKTAEFKAFGAQLCDIAIKYAEEGDISAKLAQETEEDLKVLIAKIKENMIVRRAIRWVSNDTLGYYIHTGNPFGVLVEVAGPKADELVKSICMHITAYNPDYIDVADIPAEKLDKEREIAMAQAPADKPDKIKQGIVMGKLNKWYTTVCLMKQPWLLDTNTCLEKAAPGLKVKRMVRWLAGEE